MRALAVLAAVALAAGCVGLGPDGDDGRTVPESIAALAGPSEEELARMPGSLGGTVRTAAFEPVPNATITEPRLSLSAMSDAAGAFLLEGLATGEHLLTITAPGHVTRSVTVQTQNGTRLDVEIVLEPAGSMEPFVETRELAGFLSCAALVVGEAHDCASADPNHRDVFEFDLSGGGEGAVIELAWDTASAPTVQSMTLTVETVGYGAQDIDLGNATGAGYARIEVPQSVMEKYYPEGGVMRALVALSDGGAPAAAAAQVSFTVYVTVFYHTPAITGYSVVS